jgi:hypothetical protein
VSNPQPEPGLTLSGAERDLATRLAENPMDLFQGKTVGWLEDFIRITVGSGSRSGSGSSGVSAAYYVPGDVKTTLADLTAQTGEYVFEDDSGRWLYCNGVAVSQTTYADLYAAIGPNAYGTDSGGNFFLPDPRGRALFFTGTHTNADLGDNDGAVVANRQAKHAHTNGATISGSPSLSGSPGLSGTPSITDPGHTHTIPSLYSGGGGNTAAPSAQGGTLYSTASATTGITAGIGTLAASAGTLAVSAGTLAVGGTIGTGTTGDAPAHLFIGSLLVRF